jgi:hypothetical protein
MKKDKATIARDAITASRAMAKYGQSAAKFAVSEEMKRKGTATLTDTRLNALVNFAQAQLILTEALLEVLSHGEGIPAQPVEPPQPHYPIGQRIADDSDDDLPF